MKRLLPFFLSLALFVLSSLFLVPKVEAAADFRAQKLAQFLDSRHSPLAPYSTIYVKIADKYELDYRLLPAIAGVESTFAQAYIPATHNPYGWGGGLVYFSTFEEGIESISFGLKQNYVDRGAKTVEQIGYIYCPPNPVGWATKVRSYMSQIEAIEVENAFHSTVSINLPLTI